MSVRTKYLLGEIPVTINDSDKEKIVIVVKRKYPLLHSLKGRGFILNKSKEIEGYCNTQTYKERINELEALLYEIETKNMAIDEAIQKKVVDNDSTTTSNSSSINKTGNTKSNKSGNNGENKKQG